MILFSMPILTGLPWILWKWFQRNVSIKRPVIVFNQGPSTLQSTDIRVRSNDTKISTHKRRQKYTKAIEWANDKKYQLHIYKIRFNNCHNDVAIFGPKSVVRRKVVFGALFFEKPRAFFKLSRSATQATRKASIPQVLFTCTPVLQPGVFTACLMAHKLWPRCSWFCVKDTFFWHFFPIWNSIDRYLFSLGIYRVKIELANSTNRSITGAEQLATT